jgi:pilus assembly protein Flp/PilA
VAAHEPFVMRRLRIWKQLHEDTTMKHLASACQRFLLSEDGPTAVEYAIMLALIVLVCILAIQAVGTNASAKFQAAANGLS